MPLHIGIVGFPNVGKSTLFQAITNKQVDRANYPFCTIDPNVGVVAVPDERVDKLAELTHSAKKIYTTIEFVDIAGLVEGASKGEGLGNKFLANIREVDAIVFVLRAFANANIVNTRSQIDVLKDKEILETELVLKDLETAEKRLQSLEREMKSGDKKALKEKEVLDAVYNLLKQGKSPAEAEWSEEDAKIIKSYQLLSFKPKLYLLNGEEKDVPKDVLDVFEKNNWPYIIMDVLSEADCAELTPEEKIELGVTEQSKLNELIKKSYELLNLITFLTTGPDETRAWTIKKGDKAPQAGGAIHSDFEEFFIRAEAINWQKLIDAGGFAPAREKGLIRTEGKEYVVEDGDVIEIKSGK
ncbi:MAG: redox-regulated ATPase YchF [Candidatus Pacebacteria bacterium]|nr:redox-regulated ATPase YchF [Candidatus Paceibacterota bacterium]